MCQACYLVTCVKTCAKRAILDYLRLDMCATWCAKRACYIYLVCQACYTWLLAFRHDVPLSWVTLAMTSTLRVTVLQRVAREAGHEQATFRAEDGLGWDFIVYKESAPAAPKAYPYIHHFPGGQPPAQGSPFNSVDTATVTELLKRLHPLHSFPKPLVKPPTTVPPPLNYGP